MNIIDKLIKNANDTYGHHINKESVLLWLQEAKGEYDNLTDMLSSPVVRQRITNVIEYHSNARYPESMHIQSNIEDIVLEIFKPDSISVK